MPERHRSCQSIIVHARATSFMPERHRHVMPERHRPCQAIVMSEGHRHARGTSPMPEGHRHRPCQSVIVMPEPSSMPECHRHARASSSCQSDHARASCQSAIAHARAPSLAMSEDIASCQRTSPMPEDIVHISSSWRHRHAIRSCQSESIIHRHARACQSNIVMPERARANRPCQSDIVPSPMPGDIFAMPERHRSGDIVHRHASDRSCQSDIVHARATSFMPHPAFALE
ncbi:hypothetical protein JOB18_028239 [Solea senegalensis]|uniref:Uncharacterized protein n=1 Tax=Solea senegalensis TaxID=28829 RepID=A0AAV6P8X2_SOLSE|nr:hypothetical protein JOB18_028239 [Solea senegalensis]